MAWDMMVPCHGLPHCEHICVAAWCGLPLWLRDRGGLAWDLLVPAKAGGPSGGLREWWRGMAACCLWHDMACTA